jgi:hypothetical protein
MISQYAKRYLTNLVFVSVFVLCFQLEAAESPKRWTPEKAWEWQKQQPWIVGCNYVPSYAANSTDIWQQETWDAKVIDRELGWAQNLGFNAVRVFLQYIVWENDPKGFQDRFAQFLELADKHGIRVMPVLFDDCAFDVPDPYLGKQRIRPGVSNSSWTPSPGAAIGKDAAKHPQLEKYARELIRVYRADKRILLWDLFNEPLNSNGIGTPQFLLEINDWTRAENPEQPISIGVWIGDLDSESNRAMIACSDVVTFHRYGNLTLIYARTAEMKKLGYPVICTEWMTRLAGNNYESDLPFWKAEGVGCFNWGLVNGTTQTNFPETKDAWYHDILHGDGQPYDPAEIIVIRKITADKSIDYDKADFRKMRTPPPSAVNVLAGHRQQGVSYSDGWSRYEGGELKTKLLHFSNQPGAAATATLPYPAVAAKVTFKFGPDCGIAEIYVDGERVKEVDTYAPQVDWNREITVISNLPPKFHPVTVKVSGRKNEKSSDVWVQISKME